ncbi:hypothetical protein NU688_33095 [Variovorax sp. ZS18.2.2]|uniref:hypothetical protein n=1 Tax=Variovorax sp. ZS18.2.2 TaxID=2971255 RepID=UPI002150C20D|nr:hypothetical protein [Variovorax sp. ZS18.2.2]MCR6481035.1 hypothetical protein [Variovorax sp. ZS18.2.2]
MNQHQVQGRVHMHVQPPGAQDGAHHMSDEMVLQLLEEANLQANCPGCGHTVEYSAWLIVFGEPELAGCPHCRRAFAVEAIFPAQC